MTTISDSGGDTPNPKLPLGQTIGLSYSTYFRYFGDVLRISWLWLVLALPLTAAGSWLQSAFLAQALSNMASGHAPPAPLMFFVLGNISALIFMFAGVSIAVAWHRRLLLDEIPGLSASNVASSNLWRYIGVGIAIMLIIALPAAVILVPTLFWLFPRVAGQPPSPAMIPLIMVIYIAAIFVALRLCPLLPARAVGDVGLTFKQVWHRTSGNIWRIFWGIFVCSTPPLLALELIYLVVNGFPNPQELASGEHMVKWTVISMIFSCCGLLLVPIWIGFLSHAYRHFFRPARTPA